MLPRGQFHQPDHWATYHFPKGQARDAISGVRFEDAQDFCKWLTETTGQAYRLPNKDEVKSLAGHFGKLNPFWTQEYTLSILDHEVEENLHRILDTTTNINQINLSPHSNLSFVRNFPAALAANIKVALHSALDFALHSYRSFGLTPILNLDSSLPPTSAKDLANDLALTLALTRDSTLALDLSIAVELDLELAINLSLTRDFSLKFHDMTQIFALSLIRSLEKNTTLDTFSMLIGLIKESDFKRALARVSYLFFFSTAYVFQ
jgi:hypothetical protein